MNIKRKKLIIKIKNKIKLCSYPLLTCKAVLKCNTMINNSLSILIWSKYDYKRSVKGKL